VEDFRAASLSGWSSVAPDWGRLISRVDRQLGRAAEWMIDAAALEPGDRVLELAGGPGTLSLMAARVVGEDGEVICTDFAESMVAAARARSEAERVSNMQFRVMDAEALELPDGAVDVVLCRMGFMLMADPAAALRESARVLAPGGRLALAVWSDAEANPWATVPMAAVMEHFGAPGPPPGAPGLWALADRERLRALLEGAGMDSVTSEVLDDHVEYASVDELMELTGRLAGPVRALFVNLDDDARAAITARVADRAEPYRREDGTIGLPERMLVASARRG
jgi:SAM-dependent methyltransferase